MNTTENIKIIAEFMGGKMVTNHIDCKQISFLRDSKAIPPTDEGIYTLSMLKYNSDWNWLMEVVEKIESLGYDSEIIYRLDDGGHCCYLNDSPVFSSQMGSKIEAVYNACIEFIKWYNLQIK